MTAAYAKMLYYDRYETSEGIDVNKSNKSKEYMICHHYCEPEVCNGCHEISMMAFELENIANGT